jgi:hypothetical protein
MGEKDRGTNGGGGTISLMKLVRVVATGLQIHTGCTIHF